jgi:hypothetical protein
VERLVICVVSWERYLTLDEVLGDDPAGSPLLLPEWRARDHDDFQRARTDQRNGSGT